MKTHHLFGVLLAFAITTSVFSCKKDNTTNNNPDNPALTRVEYLITPMSNAFTKITYTDSTGADVVVTDWNQFASGSKTISLNSKPFTAKISTVMNNQNPYTISFSLVILVDSQAVKLVQAQAPPMSITTTSAEYLVNK